MAYEFDFENKIISVLNPQTDVSIQDLYNSIKYAEDTYIGISYGQICEGSGKQSLGGSVSVGITLELLDEWQIKFWDGDYIAKISGGNLVGGIGGDPVAYSPGVQVLIIQSAASTVVTTSTGSGLSTEEHDKLMALTNGLTSSQNTVLNSVSSDVVSIKSNYSNKDDVKSIKNTIVAMS